MNEKKFSAAEIWYSLFP